MLNLSLTKKLELSLEKIRNYCQAQPSPSLAGLSKALKLDSDHPARPPGEAYSWLNLAPNGK